MGGLLDSRSHAWGDSSAVAQVPKSRLGVGRCGSLAQAVAPRLSGAVGMGGPRGPVPQGGEPDYLSTHHIALSVIVPASILFPMRRRGEAEGPW